MERRTLLISGRPVTFVAGTTSWHPTFEVLFVAGGRDSVRFFEGIARGLVSYANVFVIEQDQLLTGKRRHADEGVSTLLEWTRVTRVRRAVLAACPDEWPTILDFALTYPQFTLGVVSLPSPPVREPAGGGGLWTMVGDTARALIGLPKTLFGTRRVSPPTRSPASVTELTVPHMDLNDSEEAELGLASHIQAFAVSIKPSSPALARRPLRPWEEKSDP